MEDGVGRFFFEGEGGGVGKKVGWVYHAFLSLGKFKRERNEMKLKKHEGFVHHLLHAW